MFFTSSQFNRIKNTEHYKKKFFKYEDHITLNTYIDSVFHHTNTDIFMINLLTNIDNTKIYEHLSVIEKLLELDIVLNESKIKYFIEHTPAYKECNSKSVVELIQSLEYIVKDLHIKYKQYTKKARTKNSVNAVKPFVKNSLYSSNFTDIIKRTGLKSKEELLEFAMFIIQNNFERKG